MISRLFSAALRGVDAQEVEVEVNARGADKPLIIIIGMKIPPFGFCPYVAEGFQDYRAANLTKTSYRSIGVS